MLTIMTIILGVLAISLLMVVACLVKNKFSNKNKKKQLLEQRNSPKAVQQGMIEPKQIVYFEPSLDLDEDKLEQTPYEPDIKF
jgi:hypothetical protein